METKEMVKALAEYAGTSVRGLARILNISYSTAGNIQNGRVVKLSADLRKRIRDKFPEISPEWLATGDGSMLRKDREVEQVQTISNTTAANITQTQTAGGKGEECGRLWRLVEDLRREINTLLSIIERITGKM